MIGKIHVCRGDSIMNPWEEISLADYENHMSLTSVFQLQALNKMMKLQFEAYPVTSAIVFGIAGGNGLEHVNLKKYSKIYGIDINKAYLEQVKKRYSFMGSVLECKRIDLTCESDMLPEADLVIANLVIEYVGFEAFKRAILKTEARYVSCIIQINTDEETWVSNSPYIHSFDGLDVIHHQMEEQTLSDTMNEIGYSMLKKAETPLPNGKKLVMLDFER